MNPTYHDLGDHTEAFQVDFDPAVISYEKLCELFWSSHNPCRKAWSTQYKSALFYASDEQKETAQKTRAGFALKIAEKLNGAVATEILPLEKFYNAEDYHQKYALRGEAVLMKEFAAMYASEAEFRESPAAARANAYVAGDGKLEQLEKEIGKLGLSLEAQKRLRAYVKER